MMFRQAVKHFDPRPMTQVAKLVRPVLQNKTTTATATMGARNYYATHQSSKPYTFGFSYNNNQDHFSSHQITPLSSTANPPQHSPTTNVSPSKGGVFSQFLYGNGTFSLQRQRVPIYRSVLDSSLRRAVFFPYMPFFAPRGFLQNYTTPQRTLPLTNRDDAHSGSSNNNGIAEEVLDEIIGKVVSQQREDPLPNSNEHEEDEEKDEEEEEEEEEDNDDDEELSIVEKSSKK